MILYKGIFILLIFLLSTHRSEGQVRQLPQWREGMLDIHHISTGRGDAAFFIFPDGTTLLVDAGDMSETHPRTLSERNAKPMPNGSKSAPVWITDYISNFFPKNLPIALDYALITHYHDDHFGEMDAYRKKSKEGGYALTGITAVGNLVPINTMIDRGDDYPINLRDAQIQADLAKGDDYGMIATLKNYWKFIGYFEGKMEMVHETFIAGRGNQIYLKKSIGKYPNFHTRNIAVNGTIWSGERENTFSLFKAGDYPGENPLSTCLKITYGDFDYFTGGDISGIDAYGGTDMNAMESHIAPVLGAVDVATLNHHGNRDSQNSFYVRTIRPRVWIMQNWSADHPGEEVLRRITSHNLYDGERDIFSTTMLEANKKVIGRLLDQVRSQKGHIVIRVYDEGKMYDIFILDDIDVNRKIIAKYGPYEAR